MRKIAVVIPLYNHEAYIEAAIASVRAQTRPVDRIIIIDDGSKDLGLEKVRAIRDDRLTVVAQANAGAHMALNRGIEMASDCEYVAILNSDDLFHPDRIAQCLAELERRPECDVVCTGLELIDSAGAPLDPADPKARWLRTVWRAPHEDLIEWLGIANLTKTTSNLVARQAYLRAHPFQAYRYVHDYYFAILCAFERRLCMIPQVLLSYRTHPTNTIKADGTDAVTKEVLQMNLDVIRWLEPQFKDAPGLRNDFTRYFRALAENHSDFRVEVFLSLCASLIAALPEQELRARVSSLSAQEFPELAQPSSKSLRDLLIREEFRQLQRDTAMSRWMAIGRALGLGMDVLRETVPGSESKLAAFKRRLNSSRWVRLGRFLGVGPKTQDHA